MKLKDQCALVTGAGVGIGREVALELARQGADVVLSYHSSDEGARSAVDEIQAMGRRATAIQADLGVADACYRLVDEALEYLGRLDILVNNAGVTQSRSFFQMTPDAFDALYHVNIRGQFLCAQRAGWQMVERGGGVIINMLSIHAYAGMPGYSVYAGTKGAIMAWTRELAVELAPYGVRVVGVAPGAIEVPRFYDSPDFCVESYARQIPLGRIGQPLDVAKTCAFLASDEAEFLVGSIIVVDGGTLARMAFHGSETLSEPPEHPHWEDEA
jgi:NAD(P)-dependent dehydrogenase (short-subunit alcohol dehydrogenase family)